ncbi:PP2C family protein-serine/threonine phosphatase [Fluviicola taffensis]|uniref:Protein serine/threonine phosphatase n=1 Tax=Fluviicola taffensis (strain DSM 16823 / NCIMB 13979 / RW262) TaxID=755732 RepID=F2IIU3_FLUTR|nr:SpoIIE family protein phosphatase [Fluviicola taffensis]AEA42800.1 protein serine/threonine phosphatase [Fluviicola taffensis DSM 16823]
MQTNNISDSIVRKAFYESTEKTHVIACWVGLLLNLVWAISDYFVQPNYFVSFFGFRLGVSVASIAILLFRNQLKVSIYLCMFILVSGISIQNAYMWSVMDLAHFEEHTFAYMVLFIGTGMLVLWKGWLSWILVTITVVSNVVFYSLNSSLTVREFVINGGLMTLTVLLFSLFLIRSRYKLTYNEIKSRLDLEFSKQQLELQNVEIEQQNKSLEYKNKEITDSISYARNIQMASIPREDRFHAAFDQSFVYYMPKDIVSGDFYWIYETENVVYYATGDCTGHGVPGGFMTMLGLSFLEEIIAGKKIEDPAEVLNLLRAKIINALNQNGGAGESKDGMDITICRIDKINNILTYASANNSVYIVRKNSENPVIEKFPADRQPCGFYHNNAPFNTQTIQLQKGDSVYTLTDGFADQFGGPKGKKFRVKQLEQIILENCHKSFIEQREILASELKKWQGNLEQVDDVLIIGVSV